MLQRFEFTKVCTGENVERQFSRNFDIFSIIKGNYEIVVDTLPAYIYLIYD